jgi:hypothetical protein
VLSILDSLELIAEKVGKHPQRVLAVIEMTLYDFDFALKDLCSLLVLDEELDPLKVGLPVLHHLRIVQVLERQDLPWRCLTIILYATQVHILGCFLGLQTVTQLLLLVILEGHIYRRG